MTLLLYPRATSVNAWAVLAAPPITTRLIRYVPTSVDRSTPLGSGTEMAFAEIAAILLDVLQHDSAVPA